MGAYTNAAKSNFNSMESVVKIEAFPNIVE